MSFKQPVEVCTIAMLMLTGCASAPAFPPAGGQQKTAPIVANLNCIAFCDSQVSQSTALEDIKNNTGAIQAGSQNQSNTQTSSQTLSPTTADVKSVIKKEGDGR